jgi:hypothetical protein
LGPAGMPSPALSELPPREGPGASGSVGAQADSAVSHRCYTAPMPTKRRRHAITETPAVQAALDELRGELGGDRIELGELVILGAHQKTAQLRAQRDDTAARRRQLADRVRRRDIPADRAAADEVRGIGWARP